MRVTVDSSGCPIDVVIDDDEALGRLVIDAWMATQSSWGAQVADVAIDAYGEEYPRRTGAGRASWSGGEGDAEQQAASPSIRLATLRSPGVRGNGANRGRHLSEL